MSIASNALSQLICFALCLAFGICGGIFGLLYLRKSSFFERILTDFFATVCIGGAFIAAFEVAMKGQLHFYGIVGFISGVASILFFGKLLANRHKKNNKNRK